MPKLRRLTGNEVIKILESFGFSVIRIRGSHHRLMRVTPQGKQYLTVAVHGNKSVPLPTLSSIYKQASKYLPKEALDEFFFAD
jgi:predicted RNA binding protein YcfA (HicA-like mRNA interferase family)